MLITTQPPQLVIEPGSEDAKALDKMRIAQFGMQWTVTKTTEGLGVSTDRLVNSTDSDSAHGVGRTAAQ